MIWEKKIRDNNGNIYKYKLTEDKKILLRKTQELCTIVEDDLKNRSTNKEIVRKIQHERINIIENFECRIDHEIRLLDKNKLIYSGPYPRFPEENEYIKEIEKLLKENIIRESMSRYVSPIVLVKKRDRTARMCIDYKKKNDNTVPQPYHIPNMNKLMNTVEGVKNFLH